MAASTIRELLVKLGVDADKGTADLDKFDQSIEKAGQHLSNLVTACAAAAAAIAAVGAAALYQASATAESARQAELAAAALGITTQEYQRLAYAAELYGLNEEQLQQILAKTTIQAGQAVAGNQALIDAYAALGISVEELATLSPEELLARVAEGMANLDSETEKLAVATALYGDDLARKVVPLLSEGADGLAALGEEAETLGLIMSDEAIEAANDYAMAQARVLALVESLGNRIGLALMPALEDLLVGMVAWYQANKDVIDSGIEALATALGAAFTLVGKALALITEAIGIEGWAALAGIIALLTGAAGLGYMAFQVVGLVSSLWGAVAAAAAFVGGGEILLAIAAAIAAAFAQLLLWIGMLGSAFLLVEDWWTYLQGGDSLIGRFIDRFREAEGLLGGLARAAEAWGSVLEAVLARAKQGWDYMAAGVQVAYGYLAAVAQFIGGVLAPVIDWVADKLGALLDIAAVGLDAVASIIAPEGMESKAGTGTFSTSASAEGTTSSTSAAPLAATAAYAGLPAGAAAPAGGNQVQVAGDTITINGVGITKEEALDLIEQYVDKKTRATADALAGSEL